MASRGSRKRELSSPESDSSSSGSDAGESDGSASAGAVAPAAARQPDPRQRAARPPERAKRVKLGLGAMASAALEQWGLDEARVLAWAAQRGLPGVGIADLTTYRQEHPDEDVLAGVADLE